MGIGGMHPARNPVRHTRTPALLTCIGVSSPYENSEHASGLERELDHLNDEAKLRPSSSTSCSEKSRAHVISSGDSKGMVEKSSDEKSAPTSLQLSGGEDEGSVFGDGIAHQRFFQNLYAMQRSLARLRDVIMAIRVELHEQRNAYRIQRSRGRDVDAQFVRIVNQLRIGSDNRDDFDTINDALGKIQLHRDKLGPLEEKYDDLETQLDRLDFDYTQKEQLLFSELQRFLNESSLFSTIPNLKGSPTASTQSTGPTEINPLLKQFYSRVGDVSNLEDRQDGLSQNHRQKLGYREFPDLTDAPSSLAIDEELREFNQQQQAIEQDLEIAKADVRRLLRLCLDDGLKPDEGALQSFPELAQQMLDADFVSQKQRFPTLFNQSYQSSSPAELVTGFANPRDRINRWLLDMLRISKLEVFRHRSYLPRSFWHGDDSVWASLVWSSWPLDEAARGAPISEGKSSAAKSVAPTSRQERQNLVNLQSPTRRGLQLLRRPLDPGKVDSTTTSRGIAANSA